MMEHFSKWPTMHGDRTPAELTRDEALQCKQYLRRHPEILVSLEDLKTLDEKVYGGR